MVGSTPRDLQPPPLGRAEGNVPLMPTGDVGVCEHGSELWVCLPLGKGLVAVAGETSQKPWARAESEANTHGLGLMPDGPSVLNKQKSVGTLICHSQVQ